MTIARIILAGAVALTIISPAARAEQDLTGMITKIDRISGTITIQRTQSGTVGSASGGAAEEYRAQSGVSLDVVHAGDNVTFSTTDTGGGMKSVTKLQKQ
ncbi:copper-binding protein [Bradyrhizobium prioriisuperbiae]|uniref:copper-binding protein n=1 Tax=Bradyrhizobium prioriisuperbiae TaxID=2854389 RepID=UPI0028E81234|nr:copper-binding protein [Bradyrhizobium prioritasuperba]